eukprot:m.7253 g.7253  ORF g.7253 m.7253 type:complete len:166 (+) comp2729_c0_seq2:176-673(+)
MLRTSALWALLAFVSVTICAGSGCRPRIASDDEGSVVFEDCKLGKVSLSQTLAKIDAQEAMIISLLAKVDELMTTKSTTTTTTSTTTAAATTAAPTKTQATSVFFLFAAESSTTLFPPAFLLLCFNLSPTSTYSCLSLLLLFCTLLSPPLTCLLAFSCRERRVSF